MWLCHINIGVLFKAISCVCLIVNKSKLISDESLYLLYCLIWKLISVIPTYYWQSKNLKKIFKKIHNKSVLWCNKFTRQNCIHVAIQCSMLIPIIYLILFYYCVRNKEKYHIPISNKHKLWKDTFTLRFKL